MGEMDDPEVGSVRAGGSGGDPADGGSDSSRVLKPEVPGFLEVFTRTPGYFVERATDEQRTTHDLGPGWTVRFNLREWLETYGGPHEDPRSSDRT